MELECPRCRQTNAMHCSNPDCVWTVCLTKDCGWIYGPNGVIPTWERYAKGLKR